MSVTITNLAIPWLTKATLPFWLTKPRTLHNACGRQTDRLCASFWLPLTHAQSCKFCSKVDQFFFMLSPGRPRFPPSQYQHVTECKRIQNYGKADWLQEQGTHKHLNIYHHFCCLVTSRSFRCMKHSSLSSWSTWVWSDPPSQRIHMTFKNRIKLIVVPADWKADIDYKDLLMWKTNKQKYRNLHLLYLHGS